MCLMKKEARRGGKVGRDGGRRQLVRNVDPLLRLGPVLLGYLLDLSRPLAQAIDDI